MTHLLKYAKKYRKQIILGPFFKLLEAIFELVLPLFMARLVDQGIRAGRTEVVWQMALWMLAMSAVGLVCVLICQYYASIASQGFGTELRNQLMKKINQLSYAELNYFGTDTLITRMTNDINQVQWALAMLIRLVIRAPFLSIGSVVMAFYIDTKMGVIFLLTLPCFAIILFLIIRFTVPLYKKVQQKLDRLNQQIDQNLSGVRVIRAFARQTDEVEKVATVTDDLAKTYIRVTNLSALLTPATTLLLNVGILALLWFGGWKVSIGRLQQGEVLALINYMNQMLLALIVVANLVVIFTRAFASADRINEVLTIEPAITSPSEPGEASTQPTQLVTFKQVCFRYQKDGGLVLEHLNFAIPQGAMFGIIGPTGSGKSTLTQLIARFYEASSGRVLFKDLPVENWALPALREEIAFVPQTALLFSGTIRENLQWGCAEATDEACWEALETAQCADFVRQLPDGLETMINEGGKNFSGGQRQRLTIARALMRKPHLLILDDSLSALDYQTDLDLRRALRQLKQMTVLIISQRISSIQQADQILVLDSGHQVGLGTHDELLQTVPEYQEIVASQEEENSYDETQK